MRPPKIGMDWICLDRIRLGYINLDWIGLLLLGLDKIGYTFDWVPGFHQTRSILIRWDPIRLLWIRLDSFKLESIGIE